MAKKHRICNLLPKFATIKTVYLSKNNLHL